MKRVGKHFDTRETASVCRMSCSVYTVLQDMSVAVEKLRVIEVLSVMQDCGCRSLEYLVPGGAMCLVEN